MKYHNKKTVRDGITFDSAAEAGRYSFLSLLEKSGKICCLERQPIIEIAPGVKISGQKRKSPAIRYVGDFAYMENGQRVIEDVKGVLTPVYKLKRHLLALQGVEIKEVKA